jgi:AcrR family transcriptional regulator
MVHCHDCINRNVAYTERMTLVHTEALPESLRDRKKRSTRDALRRSAVALVAERGFGAVTVGDIAAAVDVSERTFFNYFSSKEDAVVGWDPGRVAELCDRLVARPTTESPPQALYQVLVEAFGRYDADHREFLQRMAVTRADPQLLAHHAARWADLERDLVTALAQRRGTDPAHDRYAAVVVATMLAAGRVAVMSWCDLEGTISLAELLPRHLDILSSGLTEPTGTDAL